MNTVPNFIMINNHTYSRKTGYAAALWRTLRCWSERASQRRALAGLDDRTLHDIGLSRSTALNEAEKPFWRP